MELDQADAEAKRLFGPDAHAEPSRGIKNMLDIFIGEPAATWKGWPPRTLLGWGHTWEQAIELAQIRATWHKNVTPLSQQNIDQSRSYTARNGEPDAPRQLPLF